MASLQNQYFMPTFDDSWLSQAFTQDNNNTLTTNTFYDFSDDPFSPLSDMVRPESTSSTFTSSSVSGSDLDTRHAPIQKRINAVRNTKIIKRKSRAGKKSTTTFINADASNFRQLVQQMTGVRFGVGHVILKPEAQRVGNRFSGSLPTLDTSALSFDHCKEFEACTSTTTMGQQGYFRAEGGDELNNECFPTLESWVGM
ncbi:Peroxisomal membrane 22 kDa family protein [Heracleum sosnowskyi]|uniref:Peroxisomal membrane 22 kDa family protein n=1 Tax=Heracleum sosnowskyi TaxID=360622 RepID=A0AAD8J7K1_9APIA|nr:Peroxisomal membrane 22 kDa family protein [Heracleum sosnowskyi]